MENKSIRVALVGAGVMGFNHLRVLTELDGVEVVAVCDQNPEVLNKIKKYCREAAFYVDVVKMLDEIIPDALIVSSATQTHYHIAKESILRGVPVLVEKPLALTADQAQELVDLADTRKVPLFVGYVERFNPVITQLKIIIDQGICGPVQHLNIARVNHFALRMARCRIGVVTDLSTHDIDLLQFITGQKITSLHAHLRYQADYDVYAQTSFALTQGVSAHCEWSWINPYRRRTVEVICDGGTLVANLAKQSLFFHKRPKIDMDTGVIEPNFFKVLEFNSVEDEVTKYTFRREEPLKLELVNFINAVRQGDLSPCQYAVDVLSVMDGIYRSGKENQVVGIESEKRDPLAASSMIASQGSSLQTVVHTTKPRRVTSSQEDLLHLSPKL